MKIEKVLPPPEPVEPREYVLRLHPDEYRDLLILFNAPKRLLEDAFEAGCLTDLRGLPNHTQNRHGLISAFRQAICEYAQEHAK